MQAFTVPTIFTAVDKYSGVLGGMGTATQKFNNRIETLNSRSERLFKKMTPALSDVSKQFLGMASAAAVAAGVIATARFSVDSIMNYEEALQSFRTIVSDLSNEDFAKFETAIGDVSKESKKSTIEVSQAFEKIAGLNSKFAETSEGLSAVTSAAITLSRASKDELGVSAENLVGILNQFSMGALESERAINVLAAGQAVGAATITQTSETFKVFGAVAKQSNLSLEQSVALTEVLASKQIMGAEAGTALRGTLVKLKDAGVGYKSGLFNTRDALEEVNAKYKKLKTAKEKDAYLSKIFGVINLTTGSILMDNIGLYDEYTKGVTGTTEATKAAEINSKTLKNTLAELSAKWVNLLTATGNSNDALNIAKKVIGFVTDNMENLLMVGGSIIAFFAIWKTTILVTKAYMVAYNIVFGINNALQKKSLFYTEGNIIAKRADAITTGALTVATSVWSTATALATGNMVALNAAMLANPIGAIILALAALTLAIWAVYSAYDALEKQAIKKHEREQAIKNESFAVQDLRNKYLALGKTKKEAESLAINEAKKNIITKIAVAKTQLNSPLESEREAGMNTLNKIQGQAQALNDPNKAFNADLGQRYANTKELGTMVGNIGGNGNTQMNASPDWLTMKPAINPKMAQQQAITNTINTNNNVGATLTIKNEGTGEASISSGDKTSSIMPLMTSTVKMQAAK